MKVKTEIIASGIIIQQKNQKKWFHYRNLCWGKYRRSCPLWRPVTNFGVDIWWQQSDGEFLEPCGIMESNIFQMSQVVFFCCPPLAHFFPCQFLEPVSFPTACYGPASELLATLLLYPPSQVSLVWPKISIPSVCHPLAKHHWALCLPLGSMLKLCLLTTSAWALFVCLSSDIQEIWHSSSSLAERVWTGSFLLQEGVWERHQLRGAVKGAVLLLGAASWVLPGRAAAPGRGWLLSKRCGKNWLKILIFDY